MAKKSSSHERQVKGYLKPKSHVLFTGFILVEQVSKSDLINTAVSEYMKRLPPHKQETYRNAFTKAFKNSSPLTSL